MSLEDAAAWTVGRYTIHGELASGGMATVHIGRQGGDAGFSKLVAVKRMHPQFAKDTDFLAMFLDEARLATRIRHPNVVQSVDVIVERGEVLLIMEYIHGEALSRINKTLRAKTERIPLRIAVSIMSGVLHGLHAAHEAKSERGEPLGIVHRDISPQNIIVGTDGVARVLDFGIAKAADQVHMTREGELKGKLVYMAPEQLLGEPVTRRTDIFSAAVVLWESLTGQRLFESESSSPLAARMKHAKIDPPSTISPDVPPALDAVVMKGLALDSDARYATARDMAFALEESVTPATHAQVAAWVEIVAAEALAERAQRIAQIESDGAESSQSIRKMAEDIASDRLMTKDVISSRTRRSQPAPQPPPPTTGSYRRVTPTPTPPPPSARRPAITGPMSDPVPPSRPPPSMRIPPPRAADPFYVPPSGAGTPPPPAALDAPAIPTEHAAPAKVTVHKIPRRGVGAVVFLFLLVGVLALVVASPFLAKKNLVENLRDSGITATVDEADLVSQFGSLRLVGVTFTSAEIPGVTVHAKEVLVDLNQGLEPTSVVLRDVEVTIYGSYETVLASVDSWRKKHALATPSGLPASVKRLKFEPAHVQWNQISGAGTSLEAKSLVAEFPKTADRELGADFIIRPTSLQVKALGSSVGPWLMDAKRDGKTLRVHLAFDQTQTQSFALDVVADDAATTIDLRVPHATPAELGFKPDAIGATAEDPVKIDAVLHAVLTKEKLDATATLKVEALRAPGGPPTLFSADATFAGPRSANIPLGDAHIALGASGATLTGNVRVEDNGFSLKLGSSLAVRCDSGTPVNALAVAIDSRNVSAATLDLAPRGCAKGK